MIPAFDPSRIMHQKDANCAITKAKPMETNVYSSKNFIDGISQKMSKK
jgi:hypothetical protein